jgi:hypothetical protein
VLGVGVLSELLARLSPTQKIPAPVELNLEIAHSLTRCLVKPGAATKHMLLLHQTPNLIQDIVVVHEAPFGLAMPRSAAATMIIADVTAIDSKNHNDKSNAMRRRDSGTTPTRISHDQSGYISCVRTQYARCHSHY